MRKSELTREKQRLLWEEEIEYYTDCHCLNKKIVISMKAVLDNNAKFERI